MAVAEVEASGDGRRGARRLGSLTDAEGHWSLCRRVRRVGLGGRPDHPPGSRPADDGPDGRRRSSWPLPCSPLLRSSRGAGAAAPGDAAGAGRRSRAPAWRVARPALPAPWSAAFERAGRRAPGLPMLTGGGARARRRADRGAAGDARPGRPGAALGGLAVRSLSRSRRRPAPIRGTVRLADELAAGAGLAAAVATVARRLSHPGTRPSPLLPSRWPARPAARWRRCSTGSTDTLRDRVALDREVAALSSQARASAAVLVVAPVVFAGLAAVGRPTGRRVLLGSPLGWACLAAGAASTRSGALWMSPTRGRSR